MARRDTQAAYDKIISTFGDPLNVIAMIAFDPTKEDDIRLNAAKELASYGNAKVKAVEISGVDGAELAKRDGLKAKIMERLENLGK